VPAVLADLPSIGTAIHAGTVWRASTIGMFRRLTAPLFYYVLKEAQLIKSGEHLGPVDGRIVGEMFVNNLRNDAAAASAFIG
jgi:hypothetical protein